jgi:phage gpG-like protein
MAGLRLLFDFYGDVQLDRTLVRFGDNVRDARPAWDKIADSFATLEARQFSSHGHAASGGWAPLSPRYGAWKAQHYPGKPIMVRSGDLMESLTRRPFGIEDIDRQSMRIGSDVDHGRWHQRGGPNLPRRRVVELTEGTRRDWVQILQRHIVSNERTL